MIKRTFHELKRELRRIDEITLLEALEITSDDLLDAFEDRIPMKRKQLQELIDDNDYDVFDEESEEYTEYEEEDSEDYYGNDYD
jgi:hypothetical protein